MHAKQVVAGLIAALLLFVPAGAKQTERSGYLTLGQVDILSVLPPAPVVGDPR